MTDFRVGFIRDGFIYLIFFNLFYFLPFTVFRSLEQFSSLLVERLGFVYSPSTITIMVSAMNWKTWARSSEWLSDFTVLPHILENLPRDFIANLLVFERLSAMLCPAVSFVSLCKLWVIHRQTHEQLLSCMYCYISHGISGISHRIWFCGNPFLVTRCPCLKWNCGVYS